MPAGTALPRSYPTPSEYVAPRKYVLVLSCVDYRLLDDLVRFLDHDNLTNRYYHAAFAGAAMGLLEGAEHDHRFCKPTPSFDQWRRTFIEHVHAAVALTEGKLTDVYIVHHEDCGAFNLFVEGFKDLTPEQQREVNRDFADALLADIRDNFCTTYNPPGAKDKNPTGTVQEKKPAVHTFFMDLRGNVELFNTWPRPGEVADRHCANYGCQCPPREDAPVAGPAKPAPPKRGKK